MNILAIETSTPMCSVALETEDTLIEHTVNTEAQHGKSVLGLIDTVLGEAGQSLSQLDCIAFSRGPGSFTGLRISASLVQGLAFAHDLPVVPLSSLQVLAQGAMFEYGAKHVLACLDARMNEVYWGCYRLGNDNIMHAILDDVVMPPANVTLPEDSDWIGVGNGWPQYENDLRPLTTSEMVRIKPTLFPSASDMIALAHYYYTKGDTVDAVNAQPRYIRDKVTQ